VGELRRKHRALRSRGYFHYFNNPDDLRHGLIAYRRESPAPAAQAAESMIILLNFSDLETEVWIPFPTAGTWIEQIDLDNDPKPPIHVADDGQWRPVRIPSNYGGVYLKLHLPGPEGYPTAARLPSPSPPISSRPG